MESFQVTNLDVSDISAEDLEESRPNVYIKTPGRYNLRVVSHRMGVKKQADGAGKKWGWLAITAEDMTSGDLVNGIIDVPLEALTYTSAGGNKSPIKAKIFASFLKSIGITNTATSDIAGHVNNLANLLEARPEFTAVLGNTQDHVAYRGKDEDGNSRYGIELKAGGALLNEDGEEVIRNDFNAVVEYYKQFKGFNPQTGLVYKSFISR